MKPDAIFTLFGHGVYLYGICIAVGILICLYVLYKYTTLKKMDADVQDFTFLVGIGAIIVGFGFAKLFQAVYDWIETGVFNLASAGITAMGGFIGGAIAFVALYFGVGELYFKAKRKIGIHKKEFNKIVLVAPICICVAHAFGRIGCLMAGWCHGAYLGQNYVFGGMWMYGTVNGIHKWGYYVPTQLYESLFLFLLFAVLSVMYFKRFNITMHVYLIAYGVWRIIIEFFRTDERGAIVLGLAPSQWQSILFIAGGIALFVIYYLLKIPFRFKKEEELSDNNPDDNSPVEDQGEGSAAE